MSHSLDTLTEGLDDDLQQIIKTLEGMFAGAATRKHGRATHTFGVGARGEARVIVPLGFPENDFWKSGKTFPVLIRHSSPGGQSDDRARDGRSASLKFFDDKADAAAPGFHDIVMNTGRVLFVRSARDFFSLVTTPNPERAEKLVKPGILDDAMLSEAFRSGGSFTDFYYHSQICYELTDNSGAKFFLRYRLINADRGPERGTYPPSWKPNGITLYPPIENDPRSENYLKQEFLGRFQHGGPRYLLQGQLRSGDDLEAVNCAQVWDAERYPWMDLAEIQLTESLTADELDVLAFNPSRTHPSIALPLATSRLWPGLQADNHASLGHIRALVYTLAQKARAETPQPHAN
jgi:hypothetical protein